jgi:hypothetical protein
VIIRHRLESPHTNVRIILKYNSRSEVVDCTDLTEDMIINVMNLGVP